MARTRYLTFILALILSGGLIIPAQADLVPPLNRTTWAPGVRGIPLRTQVCATIDAATYGSGAVNASAGIQAAINACPEGQVVQLSAGNFLMNNHVLINKAVTLRGMGQRVTTLQKTNTEEREDLVIIGPTRWPNVDETTAVNLTANAVKGAMSLTVANAAGFARGQFVKLDEDDYTTASWLDLPPADNGPTGQILATDRLVWRIHNPPLDRDMSDDALSWFNRRGRPLSEIKEVASVSGNTITFTTPIHITYTTAKSAQLVRYTGDSVHQTYAGVEDLSLIAGTNGGLAFTAAAYSWAKNIECADYHGSCVDFRHSFRNELRDSYIHDAVNPVPGGGAYAISLQQGSSEILIENNIVLNANKVMVVRACGAGSVVGYNYMDNAYIKYDPTFMEVGLNASHSVGSHHVLFEGNKSFNYDSDNTWGTSILMTIFRNHLTGDRRDIQDEGRVRAAGLMHGSWWHAFIGNVLGESGRMGGWIYEDPGDGTYGETLWGMVHTIWRLGYSGSHHVAPDPMVRSTVVRNGNFDYVTNQVHWDQPAEPIPDSLYLSGKPAFFGNLPWPWVDPTGAVKVGTLPANQRYQAILAARALAGAPFHARVFPNPWRSDRHTGRMLTFDSMPGDSSVKIFNVSGRWVKTIKANGSGTAVWDLRNSAGDLVASGLYIYLIEDPTGQKARGKFAVIK